MVIEVNLFNRITPFSNLALPILENVASHAAEIMIESDRIIFKQGDPPTGLYTIIHGRVKLYREANSRMQILALPMRGECFGVESFSGDLSSPYSVKTLTPVDLVYITPESLKYLANTYPAFQVTLLDLVSVRAREFVALVHNLAFRDVTARLATVLVSRAEREGRSTADGIVIERLLTQQELASIIGTAREVIFRTFKKFEELGVARLTKKEIIILDLDQLIEIASQESR